MTFTPQLNLASAKSIALSNFNGTPDSTAFELKTGLAQMLKGGCIMDVINVEQALLAQEAGKLLTYYESFSREF